MSVLLCQVCIRFHEPIGYRWVYKVWYGHSAIVQVLAIRIFHLELTAALTVEEPKMYSWDLGIARRDRGVDWQYIVRDTCGLRVDHTTCVAHIWIMRSLALEHLSRRQIELRIVAAICRSPRFVFLDQRLHDCVQIIGRIVQICVLASNEIAIQYNKIRILRVQDRLDDLERLLICIWSPQ